jgi:hypothetical protein
MHIPLSRTFKTYLKERQFNQHLEKNKWTFSPFRKSMLLNEIPDWEQYYLPINIKNLTILDVGAGEGESAHFFLEHGAKQVICVELNSFCFPNLIQNSKNHNIVPILKPYSNKLLTSLHFDFIKMDIEGYEAQILKTHLPTPAVIEVHGLPLIEKFKRKGYIQQPINSEMETVHHTQYFYWKTNSTQENKVILSF